VHNEDPGKITFVECNLSLRISSEPVTAEDLRVLRDGLKDVLEEVLGDHTDPESIGGNHDVDLFYFSIASVAERWELEDSNI
jgi:hypothetical protein